MLASARAIAAKLRPHLAPTCPDDYWLRGKEAARESVVSRHVMPMPMEEVDDCELLVSSLASCARPPAPHCRFCRRSHHRSVTIPAESDCVRHKGIVASILVDQRYVVLRPNSRLPNGAIVVAADLRSCTPCATRLRCRHAISGPRLLIPQTRQAITDTTLRPHYLESPIAVHGQALHQCFGFSCAQNSTFKSAISTRLPRHPTTRVW